MTPRSATAIDICARIGFHGPGGAVHDDLAAWCRGPCTAPAAPTTAGIPRSRATMAACASTPPVSVTTADATDSSGVHDGSVVRHTSTSPGRSPPAPAGSVTTRATPRARPRLAGVPRSSTAPAGVRGLPPRGTRAGSPVSGRAWSSTRRPPASAHSTSCGPPSRSATPGGQVGHPQHVGVVQARPRPVVERHGDGGGAAWDPFAANGFRADAATDDDAVRDQEPVGLHQAPDDRLAEPPRRLDHRRGSPGEGIDRGHHPGDVGVHLPLHQHGHRTATTTVGGDAGAVQRAEAVVDPGQQVRLALDTEEAVVAAGRGVVRAVLGRGGRADGHHPGPERAVRPQQVLLDRACRPRPHGHDEARWDVEARAQQPAERGRLASHDLRVLGVPEPDDHVRESPSVAIRSSCSSNQTAWQESRPLPSTHAWSPACTRPSAVANRVP